MLYDKPARQVKDHPFQAWCTYISGSLYITQILLILWIRSCKTTTAIIQNLIFKAHIIDVSAKRPEKGMFKFGEGMESL